jgi:signal peptide peptidase SppA
MYTIPKYWLGDQASSDHIEAAIGQYVVAQNTGQFKAAFNRADFGLNPLMSVQSGVAVITVAGSLVPGSAGFMAIFGATGYDDIRAMVVEALQNPDVGSIMLHVSSGGGAVNGVEDLGNFLKMAGKIKPMTTYADGTMASAAYWLGSYGSHISTGKTSILGSIGVLMIHMDRSEQLKMDGLKATVIRAGLFKALGNSVEPLSNAAKAELETQAQGLYDVFMGTIAPNRKMSVAAAETQFGQGREFLGVEAVKVGLADAIMSYDQALMYAKSLDKSGGPANNSSKSKGASAMKVTLNAEQLEAYASGATLTELGFAADAVLESTDEKDGAAATAETLAATEALTAQVATLTADLATSNAALAAAHTETATFKSQVDAAALVQVDLLTIARASTGGLLIRLGGSADGVSEMDAATILAKHAEASATFSARFKVGGVAAPKVIETEKVPAQTNFRHQALVASGPQARQLAARR